MDIESENLNDISMSINEVAEAIKLSGVKISAIYYDACLMHMLENQGNLAEVTDYTLASAHLTVGGEYKSFLELLDTEKDMVTALSKYCINKTILGR